MQKYQVAIYIRLSKEDIDKGYEESESIKNQRDLLTQYVQNLGEEYQLVDIYIDQGYTGTNFNRPSFQKMIQDIRIEKINMVITKDLSRLGRDYIETGEYIEKWFPENNVRYISVTDGIDTFEKTNGNNDIAPFKSILNDMYSKDLSKKIRTALHTMQKQGKWVGGKTPIGYTKDPNDKNKLIIHEKEAKIVKTIFNMVIAGEKIGTIKNYLNENNIPTINQSRYHKASFWENKTIKNILQNKVYIGITQQNKRSRISYKNRKLKQNPKEEWNIVENTHTPIIDKQDFEKVQKMVVVQNYSRNKKKNLYLLDGLLVCYECKHKIGIRNKKNNYMVCNHYRRNSKLKLCTSHGFSYEQLEKQILECIRNLFLKVEKEKIEFVIQNSKIKQNNEKLQKKLKQEIELIKNNIDQIYIEKLNHKIDEEMYQRLLKKMQQEIKQKEEQSSKLKIAQNHLKQNSYNEILEEILTLKHPTPEMMKAVIHKIEIHQDKQVDLIFHFKK
ncbi:MAG: recombinase family protein [Clostridia bacterium]|nr:recombinase family protein [Clostridia bacterium]